MCPAQEARRTLRTQEVNKTHYAKYTWGCCKNILKRWCISNRPLSRTNMDKKEKKTKQPLSMKVPISRKSHEQLLQPQAEHQYVQETQKKLRRKNILNQKLPEAALTWGFCCKHSRSNIWDVSQKFQVRAAEQLERSPLNARAEFSICSNFPFYFQFLFH